MVNNEIKQRFSRIEQSVQQASQAVQADSMTPMELKQCVQKLDQQTSQAKSVFLQGQDDDSIRQCVEDLEELGDRAKSACERSKDVSEDVKDAVMMAHRELSDLKHQLH